jgi:hypothetical protein
MSSVPSITRDTWLSLPLECVPHYLHGPEEVEPVLSVLSVLSYPSSSPNPCMESVR